MPPQGRLFIYEYYQPTNSLMVGFTRGDVATLLRRHAGFPASGTVLVVVPGQSTLVDKALRMISAGGIRAAVAELRKLPGALAELADELPDSPLTLKTAARLLGVHSSTVRRMFDRGELTGCRVGNSRRIFWASLNSALTKLNEREGITYTSSADADVDREITYPQE